MYSPYQNAPPPQANFPMPYPQSQFFPPLAGGITELKPGIYLAGSPAVNNYPGKDPIVIPDRPRNRCIRCIRISVCCCVVLFCAVILVLLAVLFLTHRLTFKIVALETSSIFSPSDDSIAALMTLNLTARNDNLLMVTLTDLYALGSFKNEGNALANGVLHNEILPRNVDVHLKVPVTWKWSANNNASMTHLKQTLLQCGLAKSDKMDKGDGNSFWKFVARSKTAGITVTVNTTQEVRFPCPFPNDVNNAFLSKVIAEVNSGS